MTRRKVAIAVAVLVALAATAAGAALLLKLRGSGTVSGFEGISWSSANGTSDDGTGDGDNGMDPTAFGMSMPARAGYNIGAAVLSFNAGQLSLAISDGYSGYRVTTHAIANSTSPNNFVVQSVTTGGPDAAAVVATIDPAHCGKTLNGGDREVDLGFEVVDIAESGSLTFTFDVHVVDSAGYLPGSCNAWTP